jgi:hypothetical protein
MLLQHLAQNVCYLLVEHRSAHSVVHYGSLYRLAISHNFYVAGEGIKYSNVY